MLSQRYDNWSQRTSDVLRRIAERAAEEAEENPGEWINPTPLESQITCDETGFCTVYTSLDNEPDDYRERPVGDSSGAAITLLHSWVRDLQIGDYDRNKRYIDELERIADMGS
jgi:hypothetical protein